MQKKISKGPYKMGWILVMFDLPVMTDTERKSASRFRNDLLNDGYQMMQYSIYMRYCDNYDHMKKHAIFLEKITPYAGNVRVIFITDKQWEKSLGVIGKDYKKKKKLKSVEQPLLFDFW